MTLRTVLVRCAAVIRNGRLFILFRLPPFPPFFPGAIARGFRGGAEPCETHATDSRPDFNQNARARARGRGAERRLRVSRFFFFGTRDAGDGPSGATSRDGTAARDASRGTPRRCRRAGHTRASPRLAAADARTVGGPPAAGGAAQAAAIAARARAATGPHLDGDLVLAPSTHGGIASAARRDPCERRAQARHDLGGG